ncbi:MAG TPA: efflux RND transporter permease subunit [Bacteroidia bacterium]|nr:efflux RND transporter permease subunit [Bacteroidia bacterium]
MIADTFIRRPVTAIVIALVIVILGSICIFTLPINQYPNITPPGVSVSTNYTGADAQTVEQNVATPLEESINGVKGMEYITSNSTSTGSLSINTTFKVGTDVDIAALDVQNRVGIATPILPSDVSRLGVTVRAKNTSMLLMVALYSPKGTHNITFLDNYNNIYLMDALLRVPGVGDVTTRADNFSMRIWMDPQKMASYSIVPQDIKNALNEQNIEVAAGAVGAPPQDASQTYEMTVLVNGRLNKVPDFENIVVKTMPATGEMVYLKDIARVELGKFTFSSNSYVDGKRASFLQVFQLPTANALDVANGVYAALEKLKKTFPEDVDYKVPFESVTIVKVSMMEVVKTLVIALFLVAFVVFLFLQNWRNALIPILAIPVSLIGTFIFFVPLGFTINTLTLFGFVLAIGIVVDDAIIVVEAVQHYIDVEHMSPTDATIHAMRDITAPVIAVALILAAVFVPVAFIPGIVGRLYQQFAITIAVSILISAFTALSLTPALCTLVLKPHKIDEHSKGINRFFYLFNSRFGKFTQYYSNGVKRGIHNSKYVVVLLICIGVATFFLFKIKPSGFIPNEDSGRVFVTYELPEASSTVQSVDFITKLMKVVSETPGVAHYSALSGLNISNGAAKSNSGTIFCQLKPWDQRTDPSQQVPGIIDEMYKRIRKADLKNGKVVVMQPAPIPGIGISAGFTFMIEQRSTTDDVHAFEQVVKKFVAAANKNPAIGRAVSYYSAHTPSYNLTVDREKCKKMGVSISDVFSLIQSYMGSSYVNDFTLYNRTYHVVIQADTIYRRMVTDMDKYYVRNDSGRMLPLKSLITYTAIEAAPVISHFNIFRSAEVDGGSPQGYSSGQTMDALKEVAAKVLPQGYGYEWSGLSYEEIVAGSQTIYIFMFSLIFVFLFLAALYESWSVPFSVMLSVPIGAFGAILTLTCIPALSNNVYAQIGLITLIGLAAKNAILIVEYAKVRVDAGEDLIESTIDAVKLRLRPIIMTSLAFIFGVLPMALATGAGAVARRTIGFTVLGGMVAASSLAIFIVPVLFVVIIKLAYGKKQLAYLVAHREELLAQQKKDEEGQ